MVSVLNSNAYIINLVGQYIYDHRELTITLDELASYTGITSTVCSSRQLASS